MKRLPAPKRRALEPTSIDKLKPGERFTDQTLGVGTYGDISRQRFDLVLSDVDASPGVLHAPP